MLLAHLLDLEEFVVGRIGQLEALEDVAVGLDVDGLEAREHREHATDLAIAEHLGQDVHIVVEHVDVGLGEQAEDVHQQIALLVCEAFRDRRPVLEVLAHGELARHPVDALLAIAHDLRPLVVEGLVGLALSEERSVDLGDGGV